MQKTDCQIFHLLYALRQPMGWSLSQSGSPYHLCLACRNKKLSFIVSFHFPLPSAFQVSSFCPVPRITFTQLWLDALLFSEVVFQISRDFLLSLILPSGFSLRGLPESVFILRWGCWVCPWIPFTILLQRVSHLSLCLPTSWYPGCTTSHLA